MAYHGTTRNNKQIRKLLKEHGISQEDFILANVKGKPAKTKNKLVIRGNQVKIFGSDFVATGYVK